MSDIEVKVTEGPNPRYRTVETDMSYTANIYSAGDIQHAKQIITKFVTEHPTCVTVNPTTFIYTGGVEEGFVVGFRFYPRFPEKSCDDIFNLALLLANELLVGLCQKSIMIQDDIDTVWIAREDK